MNTSERVKIYLDNCTYKRPYDDQTNLRIMLETQAKMRIQALITEKKFVLAASFVNTYENDMAPQFGPKCRVRDFMLAHAGIWVDESLRHKVKEMAGGFSRQGLKGRDAAHLASAILSGCTYIITTDDKFLRFAVKTDAITITDPVSFIRWEDNDD